MYKRKMMFVLTIGVFLLIALPFASAQDANAAPKAAAKPSAPAPIVAYRLDFSINELEDGKKLNTRRYSMNLIEGWGPPQYLKIGTRVPIQSEQGKVDYIDIGTNIWAHLKDWEKPLGLEVTADISTFPASNEGRGSGIPPLVRQLHIGATTVVILDKPMIIGSVDDPDSKRSFQLEVLVTKLQ